MTRQTLTLAWLLALFQAACAVFFGYFSADLHYDNRIERFAVADPRSQETARTLARAFGDREYLLAVAQFREGRVDPALGETLFAEMNEIEGLGPYVSLRTVAPGAAPEQLPFPFFLPERRVYAALFELTSGPERDAAIAAALDTAESLEARYQNDLTRFAAVGEPVVNHWLNVSSMDVRNVYFPVMIALTALLLGLLFRSVTVIVATAVSVGSSLATVMGVFALAGRDMNLASTLIPALTFTLATAMQVHLLISIAERGSIAAGLREKWRPNFLVSLTTSIGFGSLMISRVPPIADMGLFMAFGMWVIFLWTHVAHLGLSRLIGLRVAKPQLGWIMRAVRVEGYWRTLRHRGLAAIPVAVIAFGGLALHLNPTESNGLNYFPENHPVNRDTRFLQENVTGASLVELLVARDEAPRPPFAYLPAEARAFEAELLSLPRVRHALSLGQFAAAAPVFAPPEAALAAFAETRPGVLEPFLSKDYYRIQLLVESMGQAEYDALKQAILEAAARHALADDLMITGPLDRIIEIQRYLLRSLAASLGLTVACVLAVMFFLLRLGRRFLSTLVPNLFPLGCMALAMWALGIETSISTVMVFSIAFGIAVDDSVHLLHGYAARPEAGFRPRWRATLECDGRAALVSTLVLTLGFLGLLTSSFLPTRTFGALMAVGMACALAGDALFLPLLLRRD